MQAKPIEVGRMLQSRYRFCVPIYQRHYVWTREKQWAPFWNDIRTKAVDRLTGRERRFSHFMGAVVLEARGGFSAGRIPTFQVVDGQQRLTTFALFLSAARDYAATRGWVTTGEKIAGYLLNDKPHLMEEPDVEIFKVWPTPYDRTLFEDIISIGGLSELKKKYRQHFYKTEDRIYSWRTVPPLLSAYGYFFDRLREAVEGDGLEDEAAEKPEYDKTNIVAPEIEGMAEELKFDAIWQALVEEFKLVEITLEDGDDAQVIFGTLNERGEPLLAADLVRNDIFHRADAAGEKAEKLFAQHWKTFEKRFWNKEEKQGRYRKPRIEFFLANFIAGQIADDVNLSKLFSEYKAFVRKKRYESVSAELMELAKYGTIYREMIERSSKSALAEFTRRLLPWDVTTVFPLVMRLWEKPDLDDEEKAECLEALLAFIVRRAVCGLTTKNYNRFFLLVVKHLDENGWSAGRLAEFLLAQTTETGRFPRDEEFEQRWISTPIYSTLQPARARAILEEIELLKRGRFHETDTLAPRLTVEHLLPHGWEEHWPLADGSRPTREQLVQALFFGAEDDSMVGQIARRNRLKDTIGNLTLLTSPLNASISNGPFADKRTALEEHSLLVLNHEIIREKDWNEEKIVSRSKALFETAKEIWRMPSTGT